MYLKWQSIFCNLEILEQMRSFQRLGIGSHVEEKYLLWQATQKILMTLELFRILIKHLEDTQIYIGDNII